MFCFPTDGVGEKPGKSRFALYLNFVVSVFARNVLQLSLASRNNCLNGRFIAFIPVMPPLSPSQYWSFFVISNGYIPGKAALKVNGNSQTVDGGLLLDGSSGYLSSHLSGQNALVNPGEFLDGFTFCLKLKLPAAVLQYDNPRYILDTGEKSVNSPGVSFYLLNKKMVMEIATYDTRWKVGVSLVSYFAAI